MHLPQEVVHNHFSSFLKFLLCQLGLHIEMHNHVGLIDLTGAYYINSFQMLLISVTYVCSTKSKGKSQMVVSLYGLRYYCHKS